MNYKFWKKLLDFAKEKAKESYTKERGCNSCCPRCKKWESDGNRITTQPLDDGSDERVCHNCGFVWKAIFTPAGFIPVQDLK